jgi:flavin-dependent dehydrogenase
MRGQDHLTGVLHYLKMHVHYHKPKLSGISKALESGLAAGECAIAALDNGGPDDFTNYGQRMEAAWGTEYRRGRYFHKLAGNPKVAGAGIKLIDNSRFRDALLKSMYKKAEGPLHKVL